MSETRNVWVAAIDHRHGTNLYAAMSEEGLRAQLYEYVKDSWDERPELPAIETLSQQEAIEAYFDDHGDEWYTWEGVEAPE